MIPHDAPQDEDLSVIWLRLLDEFSKEPEHSRTSSATMLDSPVFRHANAGTRT
jgi:hypothetical protein